jgi:hypothetical protein
VREQFITKRFNGKFRLMIDAANTIIADYQAAGLTLTLRQLYYQFVARGVQDEKGRPFPNTIKSYKRLGACINDARLAGLIDWDAIEDLTRGLMGNIHYDSPLNALESLRAGYGIDLWEGQPYRVEVWIEKQALAGVIAPICAKWDVPFLACRGYVSQSEQYRAHHRMLAYRSWGAQPVVIHLGDHDPSGIDMTRDNDDRLTKTFGTDVKLIRIALNKDQIKKHKPPSNPAKQKDSRFAEYAKEHGDESWELDALDPKIIQALVSEAIQDHLDQGPFDDRKRVLAKHQKVLDKVIADFNKPKKPKRKKRKSKRKAKR